MNCRNVKVRLFEYLDEALSAGEMDAIHGHLIECKSCREHLERQKRIGDELTRQFEGKAQAAALSGDFARRFMAALESQPRRSRLAWWLRFGTAGAAALGLVAAISLYLGHRPSGRRNQPRAVINGPVVEEASFPIQVSTTQMRGNMVLDSIRQEECVIEQRF